MFRMILAFARKVRAGENSGLRGVLYIEKSMVNRRDTRNDTYFGFTYV